MREKYVDRNTLYWPDEVAQGEVIYPLRFRMELDMVLPSELWHQLRIPRTVIPYTIRGFSPLKDDLASSVIANMTATWRLPHQRSQPTIVATSPQGPELRETPVESQPVHDDLKSMLEEVGRFQNYVTAVEYYFPMEGQSLRLDVVWKREMAGVPTFAFEIELSGNLERAVTRLKRAYERWNSRPYIILPDAEAHRIRNLFHSEANPFERALRSCSPEQVRDLHAVKTRLRRMERDLGLIA